MKPIDNQSRCVKNKNIPCLIGFCIGFEILHCSSCLCMVEVLRKQGLFQGAPNFSPKAVDPLENENSL